MHQPYSPIRREAAAREGILDRKTVLTKLQNWLDAVMPATALNLTYTINVEKFPAASPSAGNPNASRGGNISGDGQLDRDGNVAHDGNIPHDNRPPKFPSRDGVSSAAAARAASSDKPDEFERPEIVVIFDGPDKEALLERGAELLLALEYLAVRSLHLEPPFFDRIRFDSGDFRSLRIAELMLSAKVAAQRVRETKQPFRLNPMAPRERRIVHLALKDLAGIRTSSEGIGEERQVVILPIPEIKK
jgi:spoIIIJ-associated protein